MVSVSVNTKALNAALARFLRDQGPELASQGARKVAFDVVRETVTALTHGGDGTPRRVDTGRLRAAWRIGAKQAGLPLSGLRGSVKGSATAAGTKPSDGYGSIQGSGLASVVTVGNAVEYARFIEFGTVHIQPGNHLTRALEVVRRAIPGETGRGSIREAIERAWSGG